MIDMHTHLLPAIDDGAESWEESLQMAAQAVTTGTTELAVTHHILDNTHYRLEPEILAKFAEMKQRLQQANLALRLHLAAEIFYQPEMELSHTISTFNNNGRYFLVEFPMQGIPRGADDTFFQLVLAGKIPIIAHPERNLGFLRNPQRAYDFVQRGALLQLNAGSLDGKYGEGVKALAMALLDSRLIHFIGSDGHNAGRRPMRIGSSFGIVRDMWGEEAAQRIFYDNPRRALAGEDIDIPEPLPVEAVRKRATFSPLRLLKKLVARHA
ncbi:MAG: hypothetical protein ONB48_02710 [candidate division KSB1 bacterium]|nr:hypothetical protein [candidate division KSB1 bacterium]MDZ7275744.1 hypothetical protein [candidate division KSB1 bacterium]MDZ7284565.1 hypothetical protein [candidate division KSB1 bacterium]MDZ7298016.1 hypothetical protein [candidate division KSB1 bacterium]MDZ7307731.1 hypothetical protein [candidate division KSB1 bacterium]